MAEKDYLPEAELDGDPDPGPAPYVYPVSGGEDGDEDGYTDGDDNWHPGHPPA